MSQPTICVLDGHTMNPGDLDWGPLEALGKTSIYGRTPLELVVERASEADILVVNKVVLDAEVLASLPKLRCICVSATGYNNIDLEATRKRNIPVCNVVGYSTDSVAQQVFSLLLGLTNAAESHHQSVRSGKWSRGSDFSYTLQSIPELAGRNMGIYGFGRIGQKVAEIAQAFGMRILATHKHPERDARPGVEFVDLPALFQRSDVISLHAPLSEDNREIVDRDLLDLMKPTAYLINTGRGGLIQENHLLKALQQNKIAGAGLDVLSQEPPPPDHPLLQAPRCLITPHLAWAGHEARQRLLREVIENIKAFLRGEVRNEV